MLYSWFGVLPCAVATLVFLASPNLTPVEGQLNPAAILSAIRGTFSSSQLGSSSSSSSDDNSFSSDGNSTGGAVNVTQYRGTRVGPLNLFRTSADNANLVNDGLKDISLLHFLGLAFGDEFPKFRDALINQAKSNAGLSITDLQGIVTNFQNWRYDRENNRKEVLDPYVGSASTLGFNPTGGDDNRTKRNSTN